MNENADLIGNSDVHHSEPMDRKIRKAGYPAGAFALAFVLFSVDMKSAFLTGILLTLTAVFAVLLKSVLKDKVPKWSLCACVCFGTGSLCASIFDIAFYYSGIENTEFLWIMEFLMGLLCAWDALKNEEMPDYNKLMLESAVVWGILIAAGLFREFMTAGSIYGGRFGSLPFLSTGFGKLPFGILTAGVSLGISNSILHTTVMKTEALYIVLPVLILNTPLSIWGAAGIGMTVLLYYSVMKKLQFSCIPKAYRSLPAGLLSAGIICMLLSDFLFTIR